MVTNDIFTKEDAEFLTRRGALPQDRILGVETGGCPHTAIREDASHNQEALDDLLKRHPDVELMFVESGGDNLAATFSPELADKVIYVIDVAAGDKIPRKGGPGITRSDLAGDQQDRSRAACRSRFVRHGSGQQANARRLALSLYESQNRTRARSGERRGLSSSCRSTCIALSRMLKKSASVALEDPQRTPEGTPPGLSSAAALLDDF